MKKFFIYLMMLLLVFAIVGCDSEDHKDEGVKRIRFKDKLTIEQLKPYDGKKVSIIGFMATVSPLNGKYIYLINMPYQTCPFCVPNTTELANTIAVYAPEGESFPFVDVPIEVTGTLEIGNFTDEAGYSYSFRIVDASYKKADIKGMEKDIQIYTALVDKGFALEFTNLLTEVYQTINYQQSGLRKEDVKPIDTEKLKKLEGMFDGLNKEDYKEPLEALRKLETTVAEINDAINKGRVDNLQVYIPHAQAAYEQFYGWVTKPNL